MKVKNVTTIQPDENSAIINGIIYLPKQVSVDPCIHCKIEDEEDIHPSSMFEKVCLKLTCSKYERSSRKNVYYYKDNKTMKVIDILNEAIRKTLSDPDMLLSPMMTFNNDIGFDSMHKVEFLMYIEEAYGIEIDEEKLCFDTLTIKSFAAHLNEEHQC